MSKVLLLNIDYEPLNVCELPRAMKLLLIGKASALHFYDHVVYTGSGEEIIVPSVIRMHYNIKKKTNREYRVSRMGVYTRDNFTCQYCGKTNTDLTLDHVIPRCKGGTHTWDNLVASCKKCNYTKAGKTLEQCGMKLLSKPKSPRYTFRAMVPKSFIEENQEWGYYIV